MENSLRVIASDIPDLIACTRCKASKTRDQFQRNPRYKLGVSSWCKRCVLDCKKENRAKRPKKERKLRLIINGELLCPLCGKMQPLENFYNNNHSPSGKGSYCKPCDGEKKRKWIRDNPDLDRAAKLRSADKRKFALRDRHLQKSYGINQKIFNAILETQGGRCAICRTDRNADGRAMGVDHDHRTGKVRGILCNQCNRSLGTLQDNWKIAQAAADYLKKHSEGM